MNKVESTVQVLKDIKNDYFTHATLHKALNEITHALIQY